MPASACGRTERDTGLDGGRSLTSPSPLTFQMWFRGAVAVAVAATAALANAACDEDRLHSLLRAAPCGPAPAELAALSDRARQLGGEGGAPWRFYLHAEGPFDFSSGLAECLFASRGASSSRDDYDDVFSADTAEHLTDLRLLRLLEAHPRRTHDAGAADVHIIGGPLHTAYAAERAADDAHHAPGCAPAQIRAERQRRLGALSRHLQSEPLFTAGEKPWLVVSTAYFLSEALGPELESTLFANDRVVIGTADSQYWSLRQLAGDVGTRAAAGAPALDRRNLLVVPYKATHWIEATTDDERAVARQQERGSRQTSFFFAGCGTQKPSLSPASPLQSPHTAPSSILASRPHPPVCPDAHTLTISPSPPQDNEPPRGRRTPPRPEDHHPGHRRRARRRERSAKEGRPQAAQPQDRRDRTRLEVLPRARRRQPDVAAALRRARLGLPPHRHERLRRDLDQSAVQIGRRLGVRPRPAPPPLHPLLRHHPPIRHTQ